MRSEDVENLIRAGLPGAEVAVRDSTGSGDHFEATVVSPAFAGKSKVQQHQLVYRALGTALSGPIHALALQTYTPEQWEQAR